jgi:AraC-like DNA-binding protein
MPADLRRKIVRQVNPSQELVRVHRYDIELRYTVAEWHCHLDNELMLIRKGRGTRVIGDSVASFEAGDLCLVGRDTPHCWQFEGAGDDRAAALFVQFNDCAVGLDPASTALGGAIKRLLERAGHGLEVRGRTKTELIAELERLHACRSRALESMARLHVILAMLAASRDCASLSVGASDLSPHVPALRKAFRCIQRNLTAELSQRQVADSVGMSPAVFSRFFKRHTGRTFQSYVAELRVSNACRLLRSRAHSITEIAFESGFGNLANFNRTFARMKGMTPSAYRKVAIRLDENAME